MQRLKKKDPSAGPHPVGPHSALHTSVSSRCGPTSGERQTHATRAKKRKAQYPIQFSPSRWCLAFLPWGRPWSLFDGRPRDTRATFSRISRVHTPRTGLIPAVLSLLLIHDFEHFHIHGHEKLNYGNSFLLALFKSKLIVYDYEQGMK